MTTYQLVPYLVHVHLRGKPKETTPLDDLFASDLDLGAELSSLLAAHRGKLVQEDVPKNPKRLRVESVGAGERLITTSISPGRSGIVSRIRNAKGEESARSFHDTELIPLRHLLTYPKKGHRAVLLAERVGGVGAISGLSALLTSTWRTKHPDWVLEIAPALSQEALGGTMAKRPIKGIQLRRTKGDHGDLRVGEHAAEVTINIRPRGRGLVCRGL